MDWSMYIPGLSFVTVAVSYIGWQVIALLRERKAGRARHAADEDEVPGLIKDARGVISRLETDVALWEQERHGEPVIKSPEIKDQHKSWQSDFEAADAPARARARREAEVRRQEQELEARRKEQLQRQIERDQARQRLADFRLLALNEAQLQTMALGYALFRIGAKLIQEELYEDENFALTCFLNYTRRNGHPFREDILVRAWDGTELWQH